jgi:hypothetical protein
MFTVQSLKSALIIAQDLHSRALSNGDDTMTTKWSEEMARISRDLEIAKRKASR